MPVLLKVKNIGISKYKSGKFVLTAFYILNFNQVSFKVYVYIKCKLYLFESLKENILISNNILYNKSFFINLINCFVYISSRRLDIIISARYNSKLLKYKILANIITFILLKSKALFFLNRYFYLIYVTSYSTLFSNNN